MRTREEQEAINKACKYHPNFREELQKLVDDPKVDLRKIDTSKITDMSHMFWGCKQFNQYIGSWDVGNVKKMQDMFLGCENFD